MRNGNNAYLTLFLSHGLTAAISIYLAVRGGHWLDRRLGTSPLFLALLVLLVIGANVHMLIKEVLAEFDRRAPRPPDRRPRDGVPGGAPDGGQNSHGESGAIEEDREG